MQATRFKYSVKDDVVFTLQGICYDISSRVVMLVSRCTVSSVVFVKTVLIEGCDDVGDSTLLLALLNRMLPKANWEMLSKVCLAVLLCFCLLGNRAPFRGRIYNENWLYYTRKVQKMFKILQEQLRAITVLWRLFGLWHITTNVIMVMLCTYFLCHGCWKKICSSFLWDNFKQFVYLWVRHTVSHLLCSVTLHHTDSI